MTDREKLIELLNVDIYPHEAKSPAEVVADYLLDNGVTFAKDTNVPSWIPVSERLPEVVSTHKHRRYTSRKSIRVLCVCVQKSGKRMVKEGYCEWYNDYPEPRWRVPGTIDSVTHWMPHPELPKEVE